MNVRRAVATELDALVGTLARAFADDPFFRWFIADGPRRPDALRAFFSMSLKKVGFPTGDVDTTDDLAGLAVWIPHDRVRLGLWHELALLPDLLQATGWSRVVTKLRGAASVPRRHPRKPHLYLFQLAVDPEHQGRGIGSGLLRPTLERLDRDGTASYLETARERNVVLYQRHGYRVVDELVMPGPGGPRVWLMWRDPARG